MFLRLKLFRGVAVGRESRVGVVCGQDASTKAARDVVVEVETKLRWQPRKG